MNEIESSKKVEAFLRTISYAFPIFGSYAKHLLGTVPTTNRQLRVVTKLSICIFASLIIFSFKNWFTSHILIRNPLRTSSNHPLLRHINIHFFFEKYWEQLADSMRTVSWKFSSIGALLLNIFQLFLWLIEWSRKLSEHFMRTFFYMLLQILRVVEIRRIINGKLFLPRKNNKDTGNSCNQVKSVHQEQFLLLTLFLIKQRQQYSAKKSAQGVVTFCSDIYISLKIFIR